MVIWQKCLPTVVSAGVGSATIGSAYVVSESVGGPLTGGLPTGRSASHRNALLLSRIKILACNVSFCCCWNKYVVFKVFPFDVFAMSHEIWSVNTITTYFGVQKSILLLTRRQISKIIINWFRFPTDNLTVTSDWL